MTTDNLNFLIRAFTYGMLAWAGVSVGNDVVALLKAMLQAGKRHFHPKPDPPFMRHSASVTELLDHER